MDRTYWEKIAPDYNEEIFDVLQQDKKGIIRAAIRAVSGPDKTVIDAGCAIGKWIPVLAPLFEQVIAADISAKNLLIAKKNNAALRNVKYSRVDFSSPKLKLPKADVILCVNAILTDSQKKRDIFFSNLSSCMKKEGHLVLVIPSLESYMFTRIVQQKWKIDKKFYNEKIPGQEAIRKYKNVQQGNLDIDHVPTKHYLEEELTLLLALEGFAVASVQKIEYDWKTEFLKPPSWLTQPQPWDWMVLAKKT